MHAYDSGQGGTCAPAQCTPLRKTIASPGNIRPFPALLTYGKPTAKRFSLGLQIDTYVLRIEIAHGKRPSPYFHNFPP